MERGTGQDSYHRNSALQARGFFNVQPVIKEVLESNPLFLDPSLEVIRIADLGCSNKIQAVEYVSREILELRKFSDKSIEIQGIFSDVTANDFNTLFATVPHLQGEPYFFSGVPGSFYNRLFPRSSIHFAMSSYALHFLSKVPETITDKDSEAWNKNTMFVDRTSPPAAIKAVLQQADEDLRCFFHHRAQEIVTGGILFLLFPVKLTQELQKPDGSFQVVWKELIEEGLLSQESLDGFNFPAYVRSTDEVLGVIDSYKQEFKVVRKDILTFPFPDPESPDYAITVTNSWKAVSKPFLEKHIGERKLLDLMYERSASKIVEALEDMHIILLVLVKI